MQLPSPLDALVLPGVAFLVVIVGIVVLVRVLGHRRRAYSASVGAYVAQGGLAPAGSAAARPARVPSNPAGSTAAADWTGKHIEAPTPQRATSGSVTVAEAVALREAAARAPVFMTPVVPVSAPRSMDDARPDPGGTDAASMTPAAPVVAPASALEVTRPMAEEPNRLPAAPESVTPVVVPASALAVSRPMAEEPNPLPAAPVSVTPAVVPASALAVSRPVAEEPNTVPVAPVSVTPADAPASGPESSGSVPDERSDSLPTTPVVMTPVVVPALALEVPRPMAEEPRTVPAAPVSMTPDVVAEGAASGAESSGSVPDERSDSLPATPVSMTPVAPVMTPASTVEVARPMAEEPNPLPAAPMSVTPTVAPAPALGSSVAEGPDPVPAVPASVTPAVAAVPESSGSSVAEGPDPVPAAPVSMTPAAPALESSGSSVAEEPDPLPTAPWPVIPAARREGEIGSARPATIGEPHADDPVPADEVTEPQADADEIPVWDGPEKDDEPAGAISEPDVSAATPGAAPQPPSRNGSSHSMAPALAYALAMRAAAADPSRLDARDRLLAVLLDDPARAVGATVDLVDCQEELTTLTAAIRDGQARLSHALTRLARSGLGQEQLAQLSDLPEGEVHSYLAGRISPRSG